MFARRTVYDRGVSDAVSPVVVTTPDGEIHGSRHGHGERTAVLLHGGPGLSDMFDTLTPLVAGLFTCVRYQQRGLPPTTIRRPYTVEANVADAAAVIDAEAGGRAWVIGFSWGGHLAMHVLVAHPERVAGAIILDPLGADIEVLKEFDEAFLQRVPADRRERFLELEAVSDAGQAGPEQSRESWELTWPCYFADYPAAPPAPVVSTNGECFAETLASIRTHAERGTLTAGLPLVDPGIPVLFVHGRQSPMPVRASTASAALIPHARLELLDGAGHFVWLEQPQGTVDAIASVVRSTVA
jgi:pimeloyl-ACP methyl ester carboxylesterase